MPYKWTNKPGETPQTLLLWPHQSLPAKGMAAFILATFGMILIPALSLLGSVLLWGILPFLLLAVWGIWHALQSNHHARLITEVLTLTPNDAHLVRTDPSGRTRRWDCNRAWTRITRYEKDGPVPNYVTLRGMGREVEIGAFLSEEERVALHEELLRAWQR